MITIKQCSISGITKFYKKKPPPKQNVTLCCPFIFQMIETLFHLLLATSLVSTLPVPDGSNYQILSLVDNNNPQGPHFLPFNRLNELNTNPTAKSFQQHWRPSFYTGFSTFSDSFKKVKSGTNHHDRITYVIRRIT